MSDVWSYSDSVTYHSEDLAGYEVEATDGDIGKIDSASTDAGRQHVVVDTGTWILGKKRLIPAGVITRIDPEKERVHVNMSKDEIKDAPDYEELEELREAGYDSHEAYYGPYRATT